MPNITKHKPGDNISARDWNALAEAYNAGSIGASGPAGIPIKGIRGKNTSGSTRSRFETMAVEGVTTQLETDGTVDLLFELVAADSNKPTAILMETIADDTVGQFILDGLALALVGPGDTAHEYAVVDAANNRLTPQADASSIRLLSPPSATVVRLVPVLIGAEGGSSTITTGYARTPSGGIPAATDDGTDSTPGSASCTEMTWDGSDLSPTANSLTVRNIVTQAIAGDIVIVWKTVGGERVVDTANCAP